MSSKKVLKNSEDGFIFSLDATLAVLVALIALAGVASVGNSMTTPEHFGRLRLQRVSQDAVRVLDIGGVFENAVQAFEGGLKNKTERILRENLKLILPERIQFKVSIGEGQLEVYPDETHSESYWEGRFENALNRAVMTKISPVPPKENYWRVLVWIDDPRENWFTDKMHALRPQWDVTRVFGDEERFRDNIDYSKYDAVFIPDSDKPFDPDTVDALEIFCGEGGQLVAGGDTLYYNGDLYAPFGIQSIQRYPDEIYRDDIEDMYLWHPEHIFNHPIISPFVISYKVDYDGDHIYYYGNSQVGEGYDSGSATVLSSWGDAPESGRLEWNGLIVNSHGNGTAVFFNMNFVQSSYNGVGTYDWTKLAARAVGGGTRYLGFKSIRLHIWRSEEAN